MAIERFIFTGPPGSGKTTLLRRLADQGLSIVDEAATDVIAEKQSLGVREPWIDPSFVESIWRLQKDRQLSLGESANIQLYDRSPICTLVLAKWLGHPVSDDLNQEIDRMFREQVYRSEIFFVENLGFITPTEARRIDFAASIRFGELHEQVYESYGFRILHVQPDSIEQRVAWVRHELASLCRAAL